MTATTHRRAVRATVPSTTPVLHQPDFAARCPTGEQTGAGGEAVFRPPGPDYNFAHIPVHSAETMERETQAGAAEQRAGTARALAGPFGRVESAPGTAALWRDTADAVLGHGRPLPDRNVHEAAAGFDLSRVRVHADGDASLRASELQAQAFSIGRHVVVPGSPAYLCSPEGRALVAHEVAHTLQPPLNSGGMPSRKPKSPVPVLWYQPVLDALARDRQWMIPSGHRPYLEAMRELCEAVTAGAAPAVKTATDRFLAVARANPVDPATEVSVSRVGIELVSRVFLLGLDESSRGLREQFKTRSGTFFSPLSSGPFGADIEAWEKIVEDTDARLAASTAKNVVDAIETALHTVKGLNAAARALDQKAMAADRESRIRDAISSRGAGPVISSSSDRNYSISAFDAFLVGQVTLLARSILAKYQLLMDDAIASVTTATPGHATEIARRVLVGRIIPTLVDVYRGRPDSDPELEITRSEFTKKGGKHRDYFDATTAGKGRDIGVEYYDREESFGYEKRLPISRIIEARLRQLRLLDELTGRGRDDTGKVTPASAENARLLGTTGLRLDSADDWRTFLRGRFRLSLARTKSKAEALEETIVLLQSYLSAFTIGTPYNIEEFGDNYLSRTFPRALTGQLIHDCGVYALRVAYMLSLVRGDLGLRFRAIVLPLHVGLIITGTDLPLWILHSNKFTRVTEEGLKEYADKWQARDRQGGTRVTPRPLDPDRLTGDVAAGSFIQGTDVPYRLLDVPSPAGSDVKGEKHKRDLWAFYQKEVVPTRVLQGSEKAGVPQPELRYLDLLQQQKDAHNRQLVPLWRQAHGVWKEHGAEVVAAFQPLAEARASSAAFGPGDRSPAATRARQAVTEREAAYDAAVLPYREKIEPLGTSMKAVFAALQPRRDEVSRLLREHPELTASGAVTAHYLVLDIVSAERSQIDQYFGAGSSPGSLRARVDPVPPFARQDSIEPLD